MLKQEYKIDKYYIPKKISSPVIIDCLLNESFWHAELSSENDQMIWVHIDKISSNDKLDLKIDWDNILINNCNNSNNS